MVSASKKIYSIGDLETLSGISSLTLRAWEKRHGFPSALRLDSGHRRYDKDTLIRLQLIAQALEKGHKISKLKPLSNDELIEIIDKKPKSPQTREAYPCTSIKEIMLLQNGEQQKLLSDLKQKLSSKKISAFFAEDLCPVFKSMGELWAKKHFNIATEHEFSSNIQYMLEEHWRSNMNPCNKTWVVAGIPGDHHQLALHFASCVLVSKGKFINFLGPRLPVAELIKYLKNTPVEGVCIPVSEVVPKNSIDQLDDLLKFLKEKHILYSFSGSGLNDSDLKNMDSFEEFEDFLDNI